MFHLRTIALAGCLLLGFFCQTVNGFDGSLFGGLTGMSIRNNPLILRAWIYFSPVDSFSHSFRKWRPQQQPANTFP